MSTECASKYKEMSSEEFNQYLYDNFKPYFKRLMATQKQSKMSYGCNISSPCRHLIIDLVLKVQHLHEHSGIYLVFEKVEQDFKKTEILYDFECDEFNHENITHSIARSSLKELVDTYSYICEKKFEQHLKEICA